MEDGIYVECDRAVRSLGTCVIAGADASALSTYRGGGRLKRLYVPRTEEEFAAVCREVLSLTGRMPFLLGGGSNTLIDDGEVRRPVVWTRGLTGVTPTPEGLLCYAGTRLSEVTAAAAKEGLGGLEFLAGVPATVGGAVHMNAGAFGAEIGDHVTKVHVLDPCSCKLRRISREQIAWGHRRGVRLPVTAAVLSLPRMSAEEREERKRGYLAARRLAQPRLPSLGSMFTSDAGAAWAYAEGAGLKGLRVGGAEISRLHGNFIVNIGGGTAADHIKLARVMRRAAEELFGVGLVAEVRSLTDGEEDPFSG